ncbi:MAG: hypothetical protein ACFFD8_05625 [Candidatus Thorarchaeota archaeon]
MAKVIMIISPLKSFRETLETLIQQGGYAICPGIKDLGSFRHALNTSESSPNIILLDFWLSRSVMINFIRSLKQQGFTVILMGNLFFGRALATTEEIGFLEKPFTSQELYEAINTATH